MVFYFSGTGNTKWAAQYIAAATGELLIDIAQAVKDSAFEYSLGKGERIGFCFPVHGWRPPMLVRDFIGKLKIDRGTTDNPYCYALCTCGDNIGETIKIFQSDLRAVGLTIASSQSLVMPESYVGLPFMDVDKPEKEQEKKRNAKAKLEAFTKVVLAKETNYQDLEIGNWPRINSRLIGSIFVNKIITDKPFRIEEDKCVKCGICADVCPVDNIVGGLGASPQWRHNDSCLSCFACYHHCPHHAIEYGNRTKHKGQYFYK